MCWALFLASDQQLPHVPWDETHPSFNTQVLSDSELPVMKQFSLPNVVYLGSHQGCGCGFISRGGEGDEEEQVAREKTIHALTGYLNSALKNGARLEMFLCWEGEQSQTPLAKKFLSVKDFSNPEFPLSGKEFANVIS